MSNILSLSASEARAYFLESRNYVSFEMPTYISFDDILQSLSQQIGDQPLVNFFSQGQNGKPINPKDLENVNYRLIGNKDGAFAWRPFEVIHPVLYISLVHDITTPGNWEEIQNIFHLNSVGSITCESIPIRSDTEESHKAEQVKNWWTNVEQKSLKLGLQFQYVIDADISNCYGSIYTHSIAWALHTKEVMKERQNRNESSFLGNRIDWSIQKMRHGQTNGIPQGSALMDFIAEIVLGYVDTLLGAKIKDIPTEDFHIIRYRDDYKIFTNKPEVGHMVIKELSEVLSSMGLHLNSKKTKIQNDSILGSLKEDKVYELFVPHKTTSYSKWLIQLYDIADKYPNSGILARQMDKYVKAILKLNNLADYDNPEVMISIVTNIAIKNPRIYHLCMTVISKLLSFVDAELWDEIVGKIIKKFQSVPNTGILDIWLQRAVFKTNPDLEFKEPITEIVSAQQIKNIIWDSSWLSEDLRRIVDYTSIINRDELTNVESVISLSEVALFRPILY